MTDFQSIFKNDSFIIENYADTIFVFKIYLENFNCRLAPIQPVNKSSNLLI